MAGKGIVSIGECIRGAVRAAETKGEETTGGMELCTATR